MLHKLCRNGGAAIFANQARSVQTIIRRIIELDSRGYDLSGIRKCSNTLEMNRIAKLVADHSFAKEIKIWRMLGNGHLNL